MWRLFSHKVNLLNCKTVAEQTIAVLSTAFGNMKVKLTEFINKYLRMPKLKLY